MIYVGIDPGKSGALALIKDNQKEVYFFDEYTYLDVLGSIKEDCLCCLEKVHSMPKQGVSSMFAMGENYGYIKGLLESFRIPYQEISPQKWKKEFSLNSDKNKSVDVCRKLFPDVSILKTERGRVMHDGKAEALLMAEYIKRIDVGGIVKEEKSTQPKRKGAVI